jgi:ABC-type nitrate/sulfonate/bicarbonate transport system substrate-binding protein
VKRALAILAISLGRLRSGTATSDCASAMVAVDEGIFKKHGLEAEMTPIGINSNIPAAILSNSIQIGGPTSTLFLQAVDGGLDLVGIAGASVMNPTRTATSPPSCATASSRCCSQSSTPQNWSSNEGTGDAGDPASSK